MMRPGTGRTRTPGSGTRRFGTRRLLASAAFALLAAVRPTVAADPCHPAPRDGYVSDGFLATCEDPARFCFADACGGDQIEASRTCLDRCPGAAIMSVVPAACPIPGAVLRRRG